MKKIIKVVIINGLIALSTGAIYAQQKVVSGHADLNKVCKQALKEKKKVLLVFSASWNPWSSVLTSTIKQEPCSKILNKYYTVCFYSIKENAAHKKLETPGADELFSNYFTANDTLPKATRKVPCMFFLDSKGRKLGQYIGFPQGDSGISDFGKLLRATSLINDKEYAIVRQSFTSTYDRVSAPPANEILRQACQRAAAEHKKVFVIFHASWCHWCHVLDTAMNDPACKKIFTDNYVICHLLVHEGDEHLLQENYGSEQMLAKYQIDSNGIPFSMIFDSDGKPLVTYNGFPSPKFSKEYLDFENKLKQTSAINDQDLIIIKGAFTMVSKRNGY